MSKAAAGCAHSWEFPIFPKIFVRPCARRDTLFQIMQPSAPSDPELLADWLGRQRESAFHALVARYAGLVYATAKRTCGDDSMAAEASQLTFIALAQKAKSLAACASLGGWLHLTAMMQAKNLIRKSQRESRKRQLLQAAMDTEPPHTSSDVWQEMQPLLDEALAALSAKDREALLLRFYRSLTIREIAATLCIATDAAQKRIDRAIERLRGKLARRGCQAGGSLSGAMLAGFAADAKAATLSVSVLSSKAIAAGAVASGTFTTLLTLMTTSKYSSIPWILILAGLLGWVGTQRQAIATLEQEFVTLTAGVERYEALTKASEPKRVAPHPARVFNADQPIDWKEVEEYLVDPQRDPQWIVSLQRKLGAMSPEALIQELDRIAAIYPSDPSERIALQMEHLILPPLIEKNPELPMRHLISRIREPGYSRALMLRDAMRGWTKNDPEEAIAWFDAQDAAGVFEEKIPDSFRLADLFLTEIIGVLVAQDLEAAVDRLHMISGKDRSGFLERSIYRWAEDVTNYAGFANLIRGELEEKDRVWPIAKFAQEIAFEKVSDYLDVIDATPAERAACAEKAVVKRVGMLSTEEKITPQEIEEIRVWAGEVAPDAVDTVTGIALAESTEVLVKLSFDEAAKLALHYHAASGNDDVLVGFLASRAGQLHREAGRRIATSIIDPELRKDLLKNSQIR